MRSSRSLSDLLRDQGRGITGALLVIGLSSLYTMEMWWLGWRLPMGYLLVYALVGLGGIFVLSRQVGFRETDEEGSTQHLLEIAVGFAELVLQSFVAAYVVLLLFGIVGVGDSITTVVRLGLIQVVPLGLGAAIANRLLLEPDEEIQEAPFPKNLPTFALGAVFFAFPVAPTQEIAVIALHARWGRLAAVVVLSVLVVHLVLFELEFRGHASRIEDRSGLAQLGTAFVVYAVGVVVSIGFLVAFGHFAGTTPFEWIQRTIVLAFIASVGASAGEVVL